MHCYQIGTNSWSTVEARKVEPNSDEHSLLISSGRIPDYFCLLPEPKIRFGHTAVLNSNYMYIFGGWDG